MLGITGSIAAYKAAILVRLLVKNGAEVKIIMTPLAKEFITPLTLATLAKNPILVDFFDPTNGNWNSHVDLGLWADAYLIAPATANTMGKMANGIADNLLLTSYLSARCPVFVAPAMDLDMYQHPANQKNIETLRAYGNYVIEPAIGELASGLEGKGRMEEPERIVEHLIRYFEASKPLSGKKILVTAGPTYEAIDPVRFIGNYSSGKMGYALAAELQNRGAEVFLVSGPTHLDTPQGVNRISITSAREMNEACLAVFSQCDAAIMAAAVADFTPSNPARQKIKRAGDQLSIQLQPTSDIAAGLGAVKKSNQLLIGFALETNNERENALLKMQKKNLDFIVLNSLNDAGAGFNVDTNKICILDKYNKITDFELKSKSAVAADIVDYLLYMLPQNV